jgi:methionyl-tRNA synthetase
MCSAPCVCEYLSFKGARQSKSRGAFVDVPYFLSKYDPDALRAPAPLFRKLDESVVEKEYARWEG